jgi:serine/threonine protein kinase
MSSFSLSVSSLDIYKNLKLPEQRELSIYKFPYHLKENRARTLAFLDELFRSCDPGFANGALLECKLRDILVSLSILILDSDMTTLLEKRWRNLQASNLHAFGESMSLAVEPLSTKSTVLCSYNIVTQIKRMANSFGLDATETTPNALAITSPGTGAASVCRVELLLGEVKGYLRRVKALIQAAQSPLGEHVNLRLPVTSSKNERVAVIANVPGRPMSRLQAVPEQLEFDADGISEIFPIPPDTEDPAGYVIQCIVDTLSGFAAAHRRNLGISDVGDFKVVARGKNFPRSTLVRREAHVFTVMPLPSVSSRKVKYLPPDFEARSPPSYTSDVWMLGCFFAELVSISRGMILSHHGCSENSVSRVETFAEPIVKLCLERDPNKRPTAEYLELLVMLDVFVGSVDPLSASSQCAPLLDEAPENVTARIQAEQRPAATLQSEFYFVGKDLPTFPEVRKAEGGRRERTTVGELKAKESASQRAAHLLYIARLTDSASAAPSTVLVAIKELEAHISEGQKAEFVRCQQVLQQYQHRNVVPYVDVTFTPKTNTVSLMMPFFNGLSLDELMTKLEGSLPHDVAEKFALALGAQLLLGLAYVHDVRKSAHGLLKPSNILTNVDGMVAFNDYQAVRDVIGAYSSASLLRQLQLDDLKVVARIMYTIAALQKWTTTADLRSWNIPDLGTPNFRQLLGFLLSSDATASASLNLSIWTEKNVMVDRAVVVEPILRDFFLQKSRGGVTKEVSVDSQNQLWSSMESDSSLSEMNKLALRNSFCKLQQNVVSGSSSFIKSTIIPMLNHRKAVASSTAEWSVSLSITGKPHVTVVTFGKSIMERFKLRNKTGVIKALELRPEDPSSHALRRAVTIMERGHHPNIVRLLAATRQGKQVHIILEAEEYGSLDRVLGLLESCIKTSTEAPTTEELRSFFLGIACQVINASFFLHDKLCAAHRDINSHQVLISSDGKVRLCGFASSGVITPNDDGDMGQLSEMLVAVLQRILPNETDLMDFAVATKKQIPYEALQQKALSRHYTEKAEGDDVFDENMAWVRALFGLPSSGITVRDEMNAWRRFDENAPMSDKRHALRGKMKEIIARREAEAIKAVHNILKFVPKLINTSVE